MEGAWGRWVLGGMMWMWKGGKDVTRGSGREG